MENKTAKTFRLNSVNSRNNIRHVKTVNPESSKTDLRGFVNKFMSKIDSQEINEIFQEDDAISNARKTNTQSINKRSKSRNINGQNLLRKSNNFDERSTTMKEMFQKMATQSATVAPQITFAMPRRNKANRKQIESDRVVHNEIK